MPNLFDKLKPYASILGKGLLLQMAPGIAAGIINELFHQWNIDVARINQDVQQNRSLWDVMDPKYREQLKTVGSAIGTLDFITPDFIAQSIKEDFPAVATLLLGSPEALEWLTRQINELKGGLESTDIDNKSTGN
jgi:hypothetical protein